MAAIAVFAMALAYQTDPHRVLTTAGAHRGLHNFIWTDEYLRGVGIPVGERLWVEAGCHEMTFLPARSAHPTCGHVGGAETKRNVGLPEWSTGGRVDGWIARPEGRKTGGPDDWNTGGLDDWMTG